MRIFEIVTENEKDREKEKEEIFQMVDCILDKVKNTLPIISTVRKFEKMVSSEEGKERKEEVKESSSREYIKAEIERLVDMLDEESLEKFKEEITMLSRRFAKVCIARGAETQKRKELNYRERVEELTKKLAEKISRSFAENTTNVKSLTSVFLRLDEKYGKNRVINFLEDAIEGKVMDLGKIDNKSNFIELVKPEYRDIFKEIYPVLVQIKDVQATRGALGPGEIMLVLFGDAKKSERGDLLINGSLYELKAAGKSVSYGKRKKLSKSGPRLTGRFMPKIPSVWREFVEAAEKYLGVSEEALYDENGQPLLNLSAKGIEEFNRLTEKLTDRRSRVSRFWEHVLSYAFPTLYKENRGKFLDILDEMVEPDGSIDSRTAGDFFKGLAEMNMFEYMLSDEFDKLLLFNHQNLNYIVINTPEELVDLIESGRVQIIKKVTWTDTQNPVALQFYFE